MGHAGHDAPDEKREKQAIARALISSISRPAINNFFMFRFLSPGYVWRVSLAELAQPLFPVMQIKVSAGLLLGLSGALAFLSFTPAKAGPNPPLSTCAPFGQSLQSLLTSGGCSRGDKNFLFSVADYISGNLAPNDVGISITEAGDAYTVNINANGRWLGTGSIGYTVEVNNTSTDLLATLTGAQQTSVPMSTFTGNTTATGTNPGTCGSSTPVTAWSCASTPLSYPFGVFTSKVTNSWNAPSGLTQISNTITQRPVPGPLPILGAAAALRVSRTLRRRTSACR